MVTRAEKLKLFVKHQNAKEKEKLNNAPNPTQPAAKVMTIKELLAPSANFTRAVPIKTKPKFVDEPLSNILEGYTISEMFPGKDKKKLVTNDEKR